MLRVIVTLAGIMAFSLHAEARNSLEFSGFRANLADIIEGIEGFCEAHPGKMMFAVPDGIDDGVLFRQSCGLGLRGQGFDFDPDWRVLYEKSEADGMSKFVLGVFRSFEMSGRSYLLAIGEEELVINEGQAQEGRIRYPVAILNRRDVAGAPWRVVINYVSRSGGAWNSRPGSISDFSQAVSIPDDNVHDVWQRIVTDDFGDLIWAMNDSGFADGSR